INLRGSFPQGGPGAGGNITVKEGKFGASAYFGGSVFNRPETSTFSNRITTGTAATNLFQNGTNQSDGYYTYLGGELSYEIDTLNLLTAEFNPNIGKFKSQNGQLSQLTDVLNQLQQGYRLLGNNNNTWKGIDLGINYQLGFKSNKERLLTFSYKFSQNANDNLNAMNIREPFNYTMPDYRQTNDEGSNEQTIQADYVHPIGKKFRVEGGLKAILRDNNSDFQYTSFNAASNSFIIVPAQSNQFTNNQDVYGAYNTYQYNLKDWGFKGGLRLEYTVVNADFISQAAKLDRNYSNLIPSLSINRKFKNMSSVNFGFTQRIQRPNIWNLNPFVDRSNPNFISSGNPDLRPVLSNNIDFGYSIFKKGSVNLSMSYSFANNTIQQVSTFDPQTQITTSSYSNIGKDKSLGGNFNANYPITKKWNFNIGGNMSYLWIQGVINGVTAKNSGLNGYVYGSTSYKFEKEWRLSANFSYSSPWIMLFSGNGFIWAKSASRLGTATTTAVTEIG
ncbi:MAG: outer membrane beta-barrel family protein, partial [Rickettsia endosymbiont of Ixodes persulcatus]|nr:outer membrane beta-barrel family protein [Rickettsia endosymbiont of Ixodes persulcatus]